MKPGSLVFLATLLAFAGPTAADAKTYRIACDNDLAFSYDGEESGTLSFTGPLGEGSLSASRREEEGMIGIRAGGETKLLMPDKAALEACALDKAQGETDSDVLYMYVAGCAQAVAVPAEPVDASAIIEISVIEPPDAMVFVSRTYGEPSTLPGGGKLEIPMFPLPKCNLQGE